MVENTSGGGGMGPMGYGLITGGADFLGTLASRIFGSGDRNRARRFAEWLQGQMGQKAVSQGDLDSILQKRMMSMQPMFNKQAESINRRLGLDSGMAQGQLANMMQSTWAGEGANLDRLGLQLNQDRSNLYAQLAARIYGGLG